ncbi:hypothetical protein AB2B41_06005 [Marimonas sp. MJW-29]|uniref:CPBP family intramembrane metalloprotease n=1 Tax=Sulfitobacter sediminis TaxID=3234186 RepID=A0ABV3RJK6_9RHOB
MMRTEHLPRFQHRAYHAFAAAACLCAALFSVLYAQDSLPGIGAIPLLPTVVIASVLGLPLLRYIRARFGKQTRSLRARTAFWLLPLGAFLALPPIAIDLLHPFPRDTHVVLPRSLLFYPAIAMVAEVVFHLVPLAAAAALSAQRRPRVLLVLPAVLTEPLFQAAFSGGLTIQAILVFGNVTLISAAQVWLFLRLGFAAMIGLRLAFYLFWHVIWGTLRLPLLF